MKRPFCIFDVEVLQHLVLTAYVRTSNDGFRVFKNPARDDGPLTWRDGVLYAGRISVYWRAASRG